MINAPPDNHDALIAVARRQVLDRPLGDDESAVAQHQRRGIGHACEVPGYRIVHGAGAGGAPRRGAQGVVYQAIQESTGRTVAIKVMAGRDRPFASPHDRARFEREIQILGQLDHPNIVGIIDSGETNGQHYFVMEYVDGVPLDVYGMTNDELRVTNDRPPDIQSDSSLVIRHSSLAIEDRLLLFAGVCDAVHAAHLHGVIHRDLKPGNILVDSAGRPRVLDFGLAKRLALDAVDPESMTVMTETGQFLGSLPWASPEQVTGNLSKIDIRSDVYSLGVVLYQMLTGEFPYRVTGSIREVTGNILSVDPARPSTISTHINDEVETILLKTLNKEPERRYQSAGDLARDIRHYLDGELIEAKRDSLSYVLRKQLRRHWIPVSVAAAFLLVITAGLIASLSFWRGAVQQRNAHESQRRRAESVNTVLHNMLASANPEVSAGAELTVAQVLGAAETEIDGGSLRDQPDIEASVRLTLGEAYLSLGKLEIAEENLQQALALSEKVHGRNHPDVALCLAALGRLCDERAHRAQAVEYLQEAVAILQATDQPRPETPMVMMALASSLSTLERRAEATNMHEQALALATRLFGEQHPDTARIRLAISTHRNGDKRNVELLREELAINQATLGPRHPKTLETVRRLAGELHLQGQIEEAERTYLEALRMAREIYGDNHPKVILTVGNLHWLYQHTRQTQKTAPLLRAYETAARATFGAQSIKYAEYLNLLGTTVLADERDDSGAEFLQRALDIFVALGRDQSWQGAESRVQLAMHAQRHGRDAEVERLAREILAINPDNTERLAFRQSTAKSLLGEVLTARGDFAQAEQLLLDGYKGLAHRNSMPAFKANAIQRLIRLYEAWAGADPDGQHAAQAEQWRSTLRELEGASSS